MADFSKERLYFFDNAKFLLVALVVIGHIIEPLREVSPFLRAVYIVIYLFHMPCFVMISGYFAHKRRKSFELLKFILLYTLFQIIFALGSKTEFIFFHPLWILWYLFAWIIWNLSLKFIPQKHKTWVVLGSFLFGILIGYSTNVSYFLSLSRIISFYPFFLLGYYSKSWWLWREKRKYQTIILRSSAIILLSTFFLIIYLTFGNIDPYKFIYYSYPYVETESPLALAWVFRVSSYVASIITGFAFFLLVPQKKQFFTKYGQNTLQVYLLHACVLYPLYTLDVYEKIISPWSKIALLIGGGLVTIFLGSKAITYLFQKIELILDPKRQLVRYFKKYFFPDF